MKIFGQTVSTTYEEVSYYEKKSGACPVCKKKVSRQRKFWGTINPFNKNKTGEIKTSEEIYTGLLKQAKEWEPDFTHDKCR